MESGGRKLCRDPERQIAARRIDVGHVPQMRATAEPHCGPAVGNAFNSYLLDDPEKPKDQDQDQQAAETDIHNILPFFAFSSNGGVAAPFHSFRGRIEAVQGIILPVRKAPDLLDILPPGRK
jgi:hypothetical protein